MKNNESRSRLVAGMAAAAALLLSTAARADGDGPTGIWVDAQPWTCAGEIGPFARHVQLACDALGGACQVAASEKQAEYRATLACEAPESWQLELQRIDGTEVLTLALDGDREARLRKAAIWTAHASVGEPPPRKRAAAAAPPPLPAEPDDPPVVVVAPPPPSEPPPPPPVAAPRPVDAPDAAEPTRRREPRGGITATGFGGLASSHDAHVLAGARALAGFGVGHGVYLGPTFTYAQPIEHDAGGDALFLGGLALGVGAPFAGRWVGAMIEGGAGASLSSGGVSEFVSMGPRGGGGFDGHMTSFHSSRDGGDGTRPAGYARAALVLQAPIDFTLRPMVALSAMHVSDLEGASAEVAMLELGVVWPGF
jgi:hypothetical protein